MSEWDYDSIRKERETRAASTYDAASRDDLLRRIIDLETALYPFVVTLDGLDVSPGPRVGAWASSALFPDSDSLSFEDGKKEIPDDFEVIAVHSCAIATSIYCGSIRMEDVRRNAAVLNASV